MYRGFKRALAMKRITPSDIIEERSGNCTKTEGGHKMNDNNSLAHTSWNCKYHIVFAPKYRRKMFYGENRAEIGKILRELCEWKGVHIVEAEVCPEYPYVSRNTAENECIRIYGISKREK